MFRKKKIAVAPLNWGLGHASRCIPIIKELIHLGHEVIILADGGALKLLQSEFPALISHQLNGFKVRYPKILPFALHFAWKLPEMIRVKNAEHLELQKIVREEKIDAVISDNRYGLYHPDIPSIIISHQLQLNIPVFKKTVNSFMCKQLQNFDSVWVPDVEDLPNLSGQLSHGINGIKNIQFIGPLSRFEDLDLSLKQAKNRKVLAIVSGPEPHRSSFEQKLLIQLNELEDESMLVQGLMDETLEKRQIGKVEVIPNLSAEELVEEILTSEIIVCRAGYSSIMDLICLQKLAILVPTKGQAEQEYLGKQLSKEGIFYSVEESELNLKAQLRLVQSKYAETESFTFNGYKEALKNWLSTI